MTDPLFFIVVISVLGPLIAGIVLVILLGLI